MTDDLSPTPLPATELPPLGYFAASLAARMGEDDPEAVKMLLGKFVDSARDSLRDADVARTGKDAEAVRRAVHKLKSSSAMIGAEALSEICRQLEIAGRNGDWPLIEARMPDMRRMLEAVLERLLPNNPLP